MSLRADNGTVLEIKEPIVLDSEGNPIAFPSSDTRSTSSRKAAGVQILKLNGWLVPLVVLAVGAFLVLGAFFLTPLMIGLLIAGLVRLLFRSFRL